MVFRFSPRGADDVGLKATLTVKPELPPECKLGAPRDKRGRPLVDRVAPGASRSLEWMNSEFLFFDHPICTLSNIKHDKLSLEEAEENLDRSCAKDLFGPFNRCGFLEHGCGP